MVTRFIDEAVDDLEYRAIFNEPADARAFAFSMLEVALATIQEVALVDEGKLYAPEQGWSDPINYAGIKVPNGWEVNIKIQDEGGKLPLNTLSESTLNRLFEEIFDLNYGESRELSSTLLDWIDPDDQRRLNGAESEDYLDEDPPYKAANGPIQTLEELKLLKIWQDVFFDEDGLPNDLFLQFSELVSVQNSGAVNLNAASPEVLEVLALEGGWEEDTLFDGIEEPYLKKAPEAVDASTSSVSIGLLRITVSLLRGEVPFSISVLVEPSIQQSTGGGEGSTDALASGGNAPGRSSERKPKTGSNEEQAALNYPFKILQLSEYSTGDPPSQSARNSAVDIDRKSNSF